jgi:uncharacterized protein (TIGR03118 family)
MKKTTGLLTLCVFALAALPGSLGAANAYLVRYLVSDIPDLADQTDPSLVGAWGISESATSPFWISDAGSGLSTLYKTTGAVIPLKVTIPPAAGGAQGIPTGTVYNGSQGFTVGTGQPALFIFDTLDGTVSGWNPQADMTHAILKVDNSSSGAVYTGLAIGVSNSNTYLYAANLHSGTIDVFDMNYAPVMMANAFKDPMLPAGYAPFNIQSLAGKLYVAYAMQNSGKNFAMPGPGTGYVDVFDTAGNLQQRLISAGTLNAPWGLAIAPAGFGDFAGDLLVGNFGDGTIHAFNPTTGAHLAALSDVIGTTIVVPNLWALQPGNGGSGGDPSAVYFTAGIPGPDNSTHGLFGRLQAAPATSATQVVNAATFQPGVALNTWISVQGVNLSSTTRSWDAGDFVDGALPTELDGVSVTLNGQPAYISYISPTQINVLIPTGTAQGPAQLQTVNNGLTSGTVTVQVQLVSPAFFLFSDAKHIAATHADGTPIGPAGLLPNSTPAKPGEIVILYANGFGQTTPPIPDGKLVTSPAPLTMLPTVTFGGAMAHVAFAGLISPGLYQINVTVPATTPDGDIPVVAQVQGQASPSNAVIAVQH